jgi:asparagine synthase (glutamine-hydrolysing)
MLRRLAPQYDTTRPKKGFSFPLGRWLRGEWRERVEAVVRPEKLEELGLEARPLMQAVERYYREGREEQNEVWYLLNLLLWHEHFRRKHQR